MQPRTAFSPRCAALRWTSPALMLCVLLASAIAHADHHEAQWSVRPFAGVGEIQESGSEATRAAIGGVSLGLAYGVSNGLDLGAELVGLATNAPRFMTTTIVDGGAPYHGPLTRRTDA